MKKGYKIQNFINTTIKEYLNEIDENIRLCNLDLDYVKLVYDEKLYGEFTEEGMSKNLSKCLCKNGEIIGCYLLNKQSMIQIIKYVMYYVKEKTYKNIKFYVSKEELEKYKNRRGIFSKFLYIDENYRNNNYGNILIKYSKTLGEYNWGVSIKNISDEYWLLKKNRIKICEWEENDGTISVLSASKL